MKRYRNVSETDQIQNRTETEQKKNGQPKAFDQFFSAYPKRVKRKPAHEIWKRKCLDSRLPELLADIQKRLDSDSRWKGGYVPDPTTYLNQERWNDEISTENQRTAGYERSNAARPAQRG